MRWGGGRSWTQIYSVVVPCLLDELSVPWVGERSPFPFLFSLSKANIRLTREGKNGRGEYYEFLGY